VATPATTTAAAVAVAAGRATTATIHHERQTPTGVVYAGGTLAYKWYAESANLKQMYGSSTNRFAEARRLGKVRSNNNRLLELPGYIAENDS
jgi:hypothetical protein